MTCETISHGYAASAGNISEAQKNTRARVRVIRDLTRVMAYILGSFFSNGKCGSWNMYVKLEIQVSEFDYSWILVCCRGHRYTFNIAQAKKSMEVDACHCKQEKGKVWI